MAPSRKRTKGEKPHVITDSLRRKTERAFAQIQRVQKDLDLRIKQLKDDLMEETFDDWDFHRRR